MLEVFVVKTQIAMAFTVNARSIANKRMKLLYARVVRVPPVQLRMVIHGIVPMANAEIVLVVGQRVIQPILRHVLLMVRKVEERTALFLQQQTGGPIVDTAPAIQVGVVP